MFVYGMQPVSVLNTAFCMTSSLFMLVDDARGDHMEEAAIWKSRSHECLIISHECLLLFAPCCCVVVSAFIICRALYVYVLRCRECVCCM